MVVGGTRCSVRSLFVERISHGERAIELSYLRRYVCAFVHHRRNPLLLTRLLNDSFLVPESHSVSSPGLWPSVAPPPALEFIFLTLSARSDCIQSPFHRNRFLENLLNSISSFLRNGLEINLRRLQPYKSLFSLYRFPLLTTDCRGSNLDGASVKRHDSTRDRQPFSARSQIYLGRSGALYHRREVTNQRPPRRRNSRRKGNRNATMTTQVSIHASNVSRWERDGRVEKEEMRWASSNSVSVRRWCSWCNRTLTDVCCLNRFIVHFSYSPRRFPPLSNRRSAIVKILGVHLWNLSFLSRCLISCFYQ